MLRPTGDRVLIAPDEPETTTESGILLPQDRDHVPVSGTVIAVGPGGSRIRYDARQRAVQDCVELVDSAMRMWGSLPPLRLLRDEIAGLVGTPDPTHDIQVGDRVAYAADCGLSVTHDGTPYVILNEDDIAVIIPDTVTEAAA